MLQLSPSKGNIPDRRQEKMTVEKTYVEQRDGGYWVAGTMTAIERNSCVHQPIMQHVLTCFTLGSLS
jgi:hypothetical protein